MAEILVSKLIKVYECRLRNAHTIVRTKRTALHKALDVLRRIERELRVLQNAQIIMDEEL